MLIAAKSNTKRSSRSRRSVSAGHGRGSSDCSGCSPTATTPARPGTSAALCFGYRQPGRPPWSTSTRSATNWPPKPPESRRFPPQGPTVHRFNAHNARDRQRRYHRDHRRALAPTHSPAHFFRALLGGRPKPRPVRGRPVNCVGGVMGRLTVTPSVSTCECQFASGTRSPKWILNASSATVQFRVRVHWGVAFCSAR